MQLEDNSDQQIPAVETICGLFFWAAIMRGGATFHLVIWGLILFPFPFPLIPKYLIPLECFPLPFSLPVLSFLALAWGFEADD